MNLLELVFLLPLDIPGVKFLGDSLTASYKVKHAMKRQLSKWEKITVYKTTNKELTSKIHKQFLNSISKNPIKK